jgi:dihydroorotate dehydrogenase
MALALDLDGIVATNTTIGRDGLASSPDAVERAGGGGLSGRPLRDRALEVIRLLRARAGDRLTLVGVGGIGTPQDALERIAAGADLLQAYTAFIYEGPLWPRRVNAAIAKEKRR